MSPVYHFHRADLPALLLSSDLGDPLEEFFIRGGVITHFECSRQLQFLSNFAVYSWSASDGYYV